MNGQILQGLPREMIALRAAREIYDGDYVNLGIGIPTFISNFIGDKDIILQSEVGMLKSGPLANDDEVDPDLINASCQPVTEVPGMVYFDILESFSMIRAGYMDVTVLGALQVSEKGDLAGWANPSRGLNNIGNIGGSMDLCVGGKKLIVTMTHTTNSGEPKVVRELTFPATARGVVDLIITDLGVMEVVSEGLLLKEIFPGITPEQLQTVTDAKLIISQELKEMEL